MRRILILALTWIHAVALGVSVSRAEIYRWDTGEAIPGTEGITPGPGEWLGYWNTEARNLRFADFSGGLDLCGAYLHRSWLDNADFSGANLRHANLTESTLTNADLSGATVTGADFHGSWGFTKEQLYSTASYQAGNLQGIGLGYYLSGWDFHGQNLSRADLSHAELTNTDLSGANLSHARLNRSILTNAKLSGAIVTGANLSDATSQGFTKEQLYSTASYQNRDLSRINLSDNNLAGWSFAGQNLTSALFARWSGADLSGADMTAANLSNAFLVYAKLSNANFAGANLYGADFRFTEGLTIAPSAMTRNVILPTGEIEGLEVRSGELLNLSTIVIDGPSLHAPVVRDSFQIADGSILSLTPAVAWGVRFWPIKFFDISNLQLGGALQLAIPMPDRSLEYKPDELIGGTYDLFDWPWSMESTNRFSAVFGPPGWIWDTSELYTSGEVTLVAIVPEPASLALTALMLAVHTSRGVVRHSGRSQRSLALRSSSA
jgi:uncharacterized protein YjbI with pentapeptide repeats